MSPLVERFLGKKDVSPRVFSKSLSGRTARQLRFEPLEERALLAVSATEFNQIRELYPDLNLSDNRGNYNVIEITASQLTEANLRNAITQAGNTAANDLIVVRTTATQNTITLSGDYLGININAAQYGTVTIVGFGDLPLTLDGTCVGGKIKIIRRRVFPINN